MECPKCGAEINDGAVVCHQCNHSFEKEKIDPKTYWMATLSACCIIAVAAMYIVAIFISGFGIYMTGDVGNFVLFLGLGLLIASPILGIVALLKIFRSNNTLGGKGRSIATIAVSSFLLANVAFAAMSPPKAPSQMFCMGSLTNLGGLILIYANDNNDQLPDPDNWCDLLITKLDISSPKDFICLDSSAKVGESSYALNKEVVGMKVSEIPPDMVLLFETTLGITKEGRDFPVNSRAFSLEEDYKFRKSNKVYKDRWNQVGGPDSLAFDNHKKDGCNILFADMHVEFVSIKRLVNLRWAVKGKTIVNK